MNWRSTGITLLITGITIAIGGAIYRNGLHADAYDCRILNIGRMRNSIRAVDCPTTMAGNVVVGIGVAVALLAVALIVGTLGKPKVTQASS